MNDAGSALTRFDFTNGEQRGSHLTLHPNCLVHRGDSYLETLPLATITSVRVAYERGASLMGWGLMLLLAAIVMLLAAAPLAGVAGAAAADLATAGNHGVARALHSLFRIREALANALPSSAAARSPRSAGWATPFSRSPSPAPSGSSPCAAATRAFSISAKRCRSG
jgi:hypothetical protein